MQLITPEWAEAYTEAWNNDEVIAAYSGLTGH